MLTSTVLCRANHAAVMSLEACLNGPGDADLCGLVVLHRNLDCTEPRVTARGLRPGDLHEP